MAYRLKPSDRTVADALRRIADGRLSKAEARLAGARRQHLHRAIHEARKEVKKVRGLLRLVRGAMPDYGDWNAALRDAARPVSPFRDLWARVETCDAAIALCPDLRALGPLREELADRADRAAFAHDALDRAWAFHDALAVIRDASSDWALTADGWAALEPGVTRVLRQARTDMRRALRTGDEIPRHDWRKRVKYHWYHARLLSPVWEDGMAPRLMLADRVAKLLGEHRNLDEFAADPILSALSPVTRGKLVERIADTQHRLLTEATDSARLLLAEPPEVVAAQWGAWYARSGLPDGAAAERDDDGRERTG